MRIGDRVYVHGYVDEIRNDTIIIRNSGGYFGTASKEVIVSSKDIVSVVRCKDCHWWNSEMNGCKRNPSVEAWYETDFCWYGKRR